jgi:hypothetical protein
LQYTISSSVRLMLMVTITSMYLARADKSGR